LRGPIASLLRALGLCSVVLAAPVDAAPAGSVIAWGDNAFGQTNVPAAAQSGVVAIAAGFEHMVALKNDGTLIAWGRNDHGQTTGTNYSVSAVAVTVSLGGQVLSGVTAVAGGGVHTLALKSDGTVVAWGDNYRGQTTGTPTAEGSSPAIANPVTLGGEILSSVTAIAGGTEYSGAILGTAAPTLRLVQGPASIVLSWPTSATGYTVQAMDGLGSLDWQPAPGTATEAEGWNTLTVNPAGTAQYFRLFKP